MTPEQYDAWYGTPRGAWIGEAEFRVLLGLLRPQPKASLLDVGCGTGWFTGRLATEGGLQVTGLDPNEPAVAFAGSHSRGGERFVIGLAERLPFADRTFDYTVCVTALCFIADQRGALLEMLRVTRRRVALGLLNHSSLLCLGKGRGSGSGGYRGAHWHTAAEVRKLLRGMPAGEPEFRSAIFLPGGGNGARYIENCLSTRLLLGGFLAVAVDVQ